MGGEFCGVDAEMELATELARDAPSFSSLALTLYNHAAFYTSVPRLAECVKLLDEVDELVERYGLRRYLMPARALRALATVLQGDLEAAAAVVESVSGLFAEGFDAWFRAVVRSYVHLF